MTLVLSRMLSCRYRQINLDSVSNILAVKVIGTQALYETHNFTFGMTGYLYMLLIIEKKLSSLLLPEPLSKLEKDPFEWSEEQLETISDLVTQLK